MNIRFEQPLWLLLVLAALPMAIAGLALFAAMSPLRRWSAAILRVALFAALGVSLAGAASIRTSDRYAVIAVIDVSDSVRRQAVDGADALAPGRGTIEAVRAALAQAAAERPDTDLLSIVTFDSDALAVAMPTARDVSDRPLDRSSGAGTNIAAAIDFAAALVPPDAAGRILLISDGNQTTGDAEAAARRVTVRRSGALSAGGANLPVDVVPLRYKVRHEIAVEGLDAPATAASGARVPIRVTLRSTDVASGRLTLLDGDELVDINGPRPGPALPIMLQPGVNVVSADAELSPSRVHRFKVVFTPDEPAPGADAFDTHTDNNSAEAFTITPGAGTVLLVDGVSEMAADGASSPLAATLRGAAVEVTVVPPGGVPTDLLALEAFDLIVLENVPADAVTKQAQEALAAAVRDLGSGMVMVGGPQSFGAGGWKGSPLEPLLPVDLDLPDTAVEPEAAILFIMDRSGSMSRTVMGSSRTQQQIANEAAARAVLTLDRRDLVGVIAFDNETEVIVPLAPNTEPRKTADAIRGIAPSGGTNLGPAMEEAERLFESVKAKVKHVIVLSDGRSMNHQELPGIAARLAETGIKISTIAVGDGADLGTMEAIAARGGGAYYRPLNPSVLPRVFLKAVRVARTPLYREEPFQPVMILTGSPITAEISSPPELLGVNLTRPRSEPTITTPMVTPRGEPLLAHWPVELGQVAVFTSDAGEWARPWLSWPGYQKFWLQMVRALARSSQQRGVSSELTADGSRLRVRFEAVDASGRPLDGLDVAGSLYSPSGESRSLKFVQTGPGVYEAAAEAGDAGTYVAVTRPAPGSKPFSPTIAGVSIASGGESRAMQDDAPLLLRIAAATGGRVIELSELPRARLFDRAGVAPRISLQSLTPLVLAWALALLLLDVATRRVAWDRLVLREGRDAAADGRRSERAAASVAKLKSRQQTDVRTASIEGAAALGEEDAAALARAERDRRIAARLKSIRASAASVEADLQGPAVEPAGPKGAAPTMPVEPATGAESLPAPGERESGLAAAKKRAAQRYVEGGDQ